VQWLHDAVPGLSQTNFLRNENGYKNQSSKHHQKARREETCGEIQQEAGSQEKTCSEEDSSPETGSQENCCP